MITSVVTGFAQTPTPVTSGPSGEVTTVPALPTVPVNCSTPSYILIPTSGTPFVPPGYPQPPVGYGYAIYCATAANSVPNTLTPPATAPAFVSPPATTAQPGFSEPPRTTSLVRSNLRSLEEPVETEPETWSLGVAPLILANVHWLDQPDSRRVKVDTVSGVDRTYPGFVGGDLALGIMADLRYNAVVGVEADLIYQHDSGSGTVVVRDHGNLCLLVDGVTTVGTSEHTITIGQNAWHLPILFKLSNPGSFREARVNGKRRRVRKGSASIAVGPEFVFPERAKFDVTPSGISQPTRATASNYVMYTLALGWEKRLASSVDLRLLGSLRGSFNPEPKDSAPRRGRYAVQSGDVVPVSYASEWRFQLGATLGLGYFF